MHTFLTRLAQVDSIQEVILVSNRGEVLFEKKTGAAVKPDGETARWNEIIAGLDGSPAAELFFEQGCYYVHNLDIGYVIVGMNNARSLERVKTACTQVKGKLADAAVRKKVMLKMMASVDAAFKPHLIRALADVTKGADREVAAQLISLLREEPQGTPQERDALYLALCEALGHCSSPEALAALNGFLAKIKGVLPEAVETAARISVQQLALDMPQSGKEPEKEKRADEAKTSRVTAIPAAKSLQSTDRQQIEELLGLGKKGEAIDRILVAIEAAARGRQFEQAETLRDWLMQIDSMALRQTIRAAEIIEQAKRASVSREFQQTWKELELALSSEEFSSLYHAMTPQVFAKDDMVVRQGEFTSSLFFVNTGRVQLYAVSQDREIPLKICAAGEIMGAANFFEISVWTVNAKSLGAELYVLTREKLQRQKEQYPALAAKLLDFCTRFPSPNALFNKTGRTRRKFERKKAVGRANMVVLDEQEKETGIGAKGDILDVSRGGLSFSLRFSKKKNAEALLGRKIRITMRSDSSNASITCNAKVVAVRCCDFIGSDYSLHVEFPKELDNAQLQQVLGRGN
ncbi:MAG TPA: hypothetical protein DDY32_12015 [Desulfobulbaceae bacterium]|nr:hypothetical protein [Desulfobulbaceae bacterium]